LKPGARARFSSLGEFDQEVQVTSRGIRGPLPGTTKQGAKVTILALGDEETLGTSVGEKQVYSYLLSRALARKGLPAWAVNGGVEGYATDQEYLWFLYQGITFRPDLVLLAFRADDAFWVTREQYYGFPKPKVEILQGGRVPRLVPKLSLSVLSWKRPFWRRSRLLELLFGPGEPFLAQGGTRLPGPLAPFLAVPPPEIQEGWGRVRALLAGLKAEVEKQGGLLLAFPIPHRAQVRGEATHAILDRYGLSLNQWNIDAPSTRFMAAARGADVEAVNPLGYFRQAAAKGKVLFYPRSGRLTPEGHLLLARILEWKLLELGWHGLGK